MYNAVSGGHRFNLLISVLEGRTYDIEEKVQWLVIDFVCKGHFVQMHIVKIEQNSRAVESILCNS